MKILSKEHAGELLGGGSLDDYLNQLSSQLSLAGNPYSIPSDSGRKTALSRLFAYLLLRNSSVFVYVSCWGVWESSENLDLFYGYRRSFGANQTLKEAPVHLFDPNEADAFVSILCMALYFIWDAWIFDIEGKTLVRISHDEWLEVRTGDETARKEFPDELEKYTTSLLSK
jgi:hypothetical protein